jgi:glycosyltransferase involved in cell wall biosynthesis
MHIAVAQIGARRHYAIPAMLWRAGLLEALYTDLCRETPLLRAISAVTPRGLRPAALERLLGRHVPDVPADRIRSFPWFALRRMTQSGRARTPDDRYRCWLDANREFGERVVACGLSGADAVYVFNGAGLEVLRHARQQGLRTIVEQTAAPVEIDEALLADERGRWPGWEYAGASRAAWGPMAERERQEWDLADVVLCGSEYVRDGLEQVGGPVENAAVVPYGVPDEMLSPRPLRVDDGEFHVLFAGTICLRKGIPYVMEAARRLDSRRVRFRAVGPIGVADSAARELQSVVELPGAAPRSRMREEYAWADVFLMPSISEGSANVCYEALGQGLPVVTTHNAGSVVRDGAEGFLVPPGDAEAIAERIEELAANRELRLQMGLAARKRAEEFTWEKYQERLLAAIRSTNDAPLELASY